MFRPATLHPHPSFWFISGVTVAMDDYTKIEKIGEGKYGELSVANHGPWNAPHFELSSVMEVLCALAIRRTSEIQLTGKLSLWFTAVTNPICKSFQTALLKMTWTS